MVNKQQKARVKELQIQIELQKGKYGQDPSIINFDLMMATQRDVHLLMKEITRLELHRNRQNIFEQGDKSRRFLARLAQQEYQATCIPEIETIGGETVKEPEEILEAFREYYSSLYASSLPSDFRPGIMSDLLVRVALGWLSDREREALVRPVTSEEIMEILHTFRGEKSPGPDGIPVEFYKKYGTLLAPKLAEVYTDRLLKGTLPDSMRQAHITLIYKEMKDPKLCSSYRPIALVNIDFKILTKILTLRLQPLLETIIDSDQTGFMPWRTTDVNLRTLYRNIHTHHVYKGSRTVAFLDIEKAFDTIEWPFLWELLRQMGFPLGFITWVQTIYNKPMSAAKLARRLSAFFQLHRGTRQGCPLSPALFAIAIESVAEALRISLNIQGLRIGGLEERVALYVDDMLLFLRDAG